MHPGLRRGVALSAERSAAYTLREAKALHELGVQNHGWYMTEAEHRGVLDVLVRLEAALRSMRELAAVAHNGDPWYAENEGIEVGPIFEQAREALGEEPSRV